MSAASDSPADPQDPHAPKRPRDREQSRPQADKPSRRPSRVEALNLSESDPQIQWRRGRLAAEQSLIEWPRLPPPEPRRSVIGQFALVVGVSLLSALAVVAFYGFANLTFDEGPDGAAPPGAVVPAPDAPASVAAAVPVIAALPSRAAAVRGLTDSEIRFGIAAPFSGPARELGRQMKLGLDTAFGAINDAGGINGRQLRLIAVDDGYEPSRTLGAMKDLVEKQGVFGIVGNVGTPTATVALPYALQQKMLFFGAFTGAGLLRRDPPDRYVFNYRASYAEETEATVNYLVKVRRLKPDQIAVFAQQDGYGDSGYAGVVKAVRALHGDPDRVLRLNYTRNTVDVDPAVKALRAHKGPIKAVIMVPTYRAAARFIEKTHDLYPGLIYTNVSFVGSTALAEELKLLGPQYADGVIVTQVVPAVDGYSSFVLDYKKALALEFPGEAADYVSLEGYVAGSLLAEGLRRTGPQVDTEKLVDALESLRDYDAGLGTPLTFGRTEHQASHRVWGTQLTAEGRYRLFDMQ